MLGTIVRGRLLHFINDSRVQLCDDIIITQATKQKNTKGDAGHDEVDDDENNILSNKPERVCMIER